MEPLEQFPLRQFPARSASHAATSAVLPSNLPEHLSPFILQSDARLLGAFSPQEPRLGAPPLRRRRTGVVDVDVTRVMDVPYNLEPRRARASLGLQWEESLPGIFI